MSAIAQSPRALSTDAQYVQTDPMISSHATYGIQSVAAEVLSQNASALDPKRRKMPQATIQHTPASLSSPTTPTSTPPASPKVVVLQPEPQRIVVTPPAPKPAAPAPKPVIVMTPTPAQKAPAKAAVQPKTNNENLKIALIVIAAIAFAALALLTIAFFLGVLPLPFFAVAGGICLAIGVGCLVAALTQNNEKLAVQTACLIAKSVALAALS